MSKDPLPTRRLRKEFAEILPVAADFDAFCLDYFPKVFHRFSSGMDRVAKETLLLSHYDPAKLEEALQEVRETSSDYDGSSSASYAAQSFDEGASAPWPWFQRQWFGVRRPTRQSIREFLDVYLGTSRQPAAFGGRTEDKRQILEWLADPAARPYRVLRAVTGRGKSALLSRVVSAAGEQQDLDLVYVPISMRFRLARLGDVLHALIGQLAALFNEKPALPTALEESMAVLQEQLRRPVPKGRRRLVVVDGLDEIVGWQFQSGLFPQEPSFATKVLLSFRKLEEDDGVQWQRQLGLAPRLVEEMSLLPLGRADVLEALRSAELSRIERTREALLAERLFKLSIGDPLVLGLLLEECESEAGLSQLLNGREVDLQVGLRGCWERMLKPTERDALSADGVSPTWQLMALFACAQAPLPRKDVIALAEFGSGEALDRALAPVQRWILRARAGYVFNHPGLRQFVHDEKLSPAERTRWHRRFVGWCEKAYDGTASSHRTPAAVSRYPLEWLSTHLVLSDAAPDAFLRLLSSERKQAWECDPLGYNGLLLDTEQVIDSTFAACQTALAAQQDQAVPYLPELVRGALWRSSIHSYTGNLDLALLIPLVEHSLLTPQRAIAHLQQRFLKSASELHRSMIDAEPVRELFRFLFKRVPEDTVELAITMADGDEYWNPHAVLLDLLPELAKKNEASTLIRVRNLRSTWLKIRALLTIGEAQPKGTPIPFQQEIFELVKTLPRPHGFLNMLPWALPRLSDEQKEELRTLALTVARGISDLPAKCNRLLALVKSFSQPEERKTIFLEAVDAAIHSDKDYDVVHCLQKLAEVNGETAKTAFQQVMTAGCEDAIVHWLFGPQGSLSERQTQLRELLSADDYAKVRSAIIRGVAKAWDEDWNLDHLRRLVVIGAADDALTIVRNTKDERKKRSGLLHLVDLLSQAEQLTVLEEALRKRQGYEARSLVEKLLSVPDAPVPTVRKILQHTVDPMARALGFFHLLKRADEDQKKELRADLEKVEPTITEPNEMIEILEFLFGSSPSVELLDELLKCAAEQTERSSSTWREDGLLSRLARYLPEPYRRRVLERRVELIDKAPKHLHANNLLSLLEFPDVPPELRKQAIERHKGDVHGARLVTLLQHLDSVEERTELLNNELARTQSLHDESERIIAAGSLATSETLCQYLINAAKALTNLESRWLVLIDLERRLPVLREVARAEATAAAMVVVDSPRLTARSYLLHYGSAEQLRILVDKYRTRILVLIQEFEPILKRWRNLPFDETETEYHDLSHDKQTAINELRDLIISIGGRLDEKTAEQLLEARPWFWIDVTAALLPALGSARKAAVLAEAQKRVLDLPENRRADALSHLAEHVQEDERNTAISKILAHPEPTLHSRLLWTIAPLLTAEHLPRFVRAIAFAAQSFLANLVATIERTPASLRQALANGLYEKLRQPEVPQNNSLIILLAPYLEGEPANDARKRSGKQPPRNRLVMLEQVQLKLRERGAKRSELFTALSELAPLVKSLGPPEVGDLLAEEVLAIGAVWP